MNPSPYQTEAERLEARRNAARESKRRKAKASGEDHETRQICLALISSGRGPTWRRDLIIQIADKLKQEESCP